MDLETFSPCPICRSGRPEFICKAVLYSDVAREICRCRGCGAAYFFPVPPQEEIARCYPVAYFRGFFKQYWKDYYKGRALALRLLDWRPKGRLLDVGCALGTMLAGARDYSGWSVQGLEFSAEAAGMGSALNNVSIVSSSVAGAPFQEGSFDYINVNNVLEHESDPLAAIKKVSKLLIAGGRLELTVPNGPVDLLPNLTFYRRGFVVKTRHDGHLFFFRRRTLEWILDNAGFRVISFKNFHFKQGCKSRGWFPNAYRSFLRPGAFVPESGGEGRSLAVRGPEAFAATPALILEDYKRLIPPQPDWSVYYARYRLRRLFYASGTDFGCDFKIVAEKE